MFFSPPPHTVVFFQKLGGNERKYEAAHQTAQDSSRALTAR
jgi:hypothetical protein